MLYKKKKKINALCCRNMSSLSECLGVLFAWALVLLCLGLKIWGSANEAVQGLVLGETQSLSSSWDKRCIVAVHRGNSLGVFFSITGLIYQE